MTIPLQMQKCVIEDELPLRSKNGNLWLRVSCLSNFGEDISKDSRQSAAAPINEVWTDSLENDSLFFGFVYLLEPVICAIAGRYVCEKSVFIGFVFVHLHENGNGVSVCATACMCMRLHLHVWVGIRLFAYTCLCVFLPMT